MKAVDELGAVQAAIAELRKQEAELKGWIFEQDQIGLETIGDLFKATVITQERTCVDWKAIALKMEPSRQLVQAHTEVKEVISIKVTAKSTAALKLVA
jgi:hypothetical protein